MFEILLWIDLERLFKSMHLLLKSVYIVFGRFSCYLDDFSLVCFWLFRFYRDLNESTEHHYCANLGRLFREIRSRMALPYDNLGRLCSDGLHKFGCIRIPWKQLGW